MLNFSRPEPGSPWVVRVTQFADLSERAVGPFPRHRDTATWIEANRTDAWDTVQVIGLDDPGSRYRADTTPVYLMGPFVKDEDAYLNPGQWHDESEKYGYFLGGIAHYYVVQLGEKYYGEGDTLPWRLTYAAMTPERALQAAETAIAGHPEWEPTRLTPAEARALDDGLWRCPGCGRRRGEVPTGHDWNTQGKPCTWLNSTGSARTRWWPDGTVREEHWTEEAAEREKAHAQPDRGDDA